MSDVIEKFTNPASTEGAAEQEAASFEQQATDLMHVFIKQGLLIAVPCDRVTCDDENWIYFTYDILPMYPPDLVSFGVVH